MVGLEKSKKAHLLIEGGFRPDAIIRTLDLRRPIYRQTATYGHFGREDLDLPWERTDKAEILKKEAGLSKFEAQNQVKSPCSTISCLNISSGC